MEKIDDGSADQFAIEIAEDTAETFTGVKDGAVAASAGREVRVSSPESEDSCSEESCCRPKADEIGWRALRHEIAAW